MRPFATSAASGNYCNSRQTSYAHSTRPSRRCRMRSARDGRRSTRLKIPARVNSLLVVHQRRVDRALTVLQHCNEQLHNAEVERTNKYERLLGMQSQRQRELSRQGEVGAGTSRCALSATGLAAARNRLEW